MEPPPNPGSTVSLAASVVCGSSTGITTLAAPPPWRISVVSVSGDVVVGATSTGVGVVVVVDTEDEVVVVLGITSIIEVVVVSIITVEDIRSPLPPPDALGYAIVVNPDARLESVGDDVGLGMVENPEESCKSFVGLASPPPTAEVASGAGMVENPEESWRLSVGLASPPPTAEVAPGAGIVENPEES